MCNTHTRYQLWHLNIVDAPSRTVAYNIAKMQSSKIDVALLPAYTFFGMEVWNGIRKKILVWNEIWNGRLLVWNGNGMDQNCQYGIRKNCLPFHAMPCRQHKSKKIYSLQSKLACFFLKLNTISCFILSRDVEAEAGSRSG